MSALLEREVMEAGQELPMSQRPVNGQSSEVALLGVAIGSGNRGIGALTFGTFASLGHSLENAGISIVDYGRMASVYAAKYEGQVVPIETILLRFSKKLWLPNHILRLLALAALFRRGRTQRPASKNPWLRSLDETDVFLAISGGDSFSDIYGLQRLLYVALPQILAIALGKPLVLLPQTYGPFRCRAARSIARFILKRAKLIYSRDQEGLKVVEQLLGSKDSKAKFAYDMGFALEPLPPSKDAKNKLEQLKVGGTLVGLNVSGLLCLGGYSRENMFGLKSDYPSLVRSIIDFLCGKCDCQVLLVPHVFGDTEDSESDVPASKRIMVELAKQYPNRLHYIEGNFDEHEIKYIIGQCDFFLGSRMHACIAALSQCVPAVGLAYSRKFAGVLESVGGGSRVLDLREMEKGQILSAIGETLKRREHLRQELEDRMPAIKESVLNLFASPEFKTLLPPM